MKKIIVLLAVLSIGFAACKKDKALPSTETENLAVENATVIVAGNLSFTSKTNTGSAKVYRQKNGKYVLALQKMNLAAGSSMAIYLSSTNTVSSTAIEICSVINLNGDVFYVLPSNIDFALFKYLIIQTELSEEIVAIAELN